jgi:hypothetical protein
MQRTRGIQGWVLCLLLIMFIPLVPVTARGQSLQSGTFQGRNSNGDFISVTLVKVGQGVLVKRFLAVWNG